jgi:hypothetical protein
MTYGTDNLSTEQIEADHVRLKAVMASISDDLDRSVTPSEFSAWKTTFILSLRDFQSQLLKHFDLEEDGGFIEDMKRLAPQWMHRIEGVERDHDRLRKRLREIISDLKACRSYSEYREMACKGRIIQLIDHLHEHEREETDMIQLAHNQVYGAGD